MSCSEIPTGGSGGSALRSRRTLGAFFLASLVTLGGSVAAQARTVHPSIDYLRSVKVSTVIDQSAPSSTPGPVSSFAVRLRTAKRVDSIGTLDGPLETVMGMIVDVAVSRTGEVFVLDIANQMIRGFSSAGIPLVQLGRLGSGPSDLRTPISIWTESDSVIVVADAVLGVKYFAANPRRGLPTRVLRLPTPPMAACPMADLVVSVGTMEGSTGDGSMPGTEALGAMTGRDGVVVRKFGESYSSANAMVRRSMSEGVVACASDGTIVAALSKLPFVTGYAKDGTPRWTARLSEFVVGKNVEESNARGQRSIGLDETDPRNSYIRRITPIGSSFVVVQVGLMTVESLRDRSIWSRIDSYLLDTRSGRGEFVGSRLPLLAGTHGRKLVGFENDPYPRVVMLDIPPN